jgi:hypothetical protein
VPPISLSLSLSLSLSGLLKYPMRQKWIRNNNILEEEEEEEERQNLIQSAEEEVDEVLILPLQHATDKPASLMDSRT